MCHEMAGGTSVVIIFSRGGKEMKKRILALALVASMCVSLAACGNSGSKETEGTAANSSSAAAETTASGETEVNWIQSTTAVFMKARLSKMSVILWSSTTRIYLSMYLLWQQTGQFLMMV